MFKFIALIFSVSVITTQTFAACPAAPVGNVGDRVIQMAQNGDGVTGMGPTNSVTATEEGAVVYDAINKTLVVCDGTNWVQLGGGGGNCTLDVLPMYICGSIPSCSADRKQTSGIDHSNCGGSGNNNGYSIKCAKIICN